VRDDKQRTFSKSRGFGELDDAFPLTMNQRPRASVLECACPLALSTRPDCPSQSARGLAHSKTWRPFGGSWRDSISEVRTRIAAMNRRLRIFVPGGTKICTALEHGGSWVASTCLRTRIGAMNLRPRLSVLDCASPLALSTRRGGSSQSARGLAHSKTWRPFGGSRGGETRAPTVPSQTPSQWPTFLKPQPNSSLHP